MDYTQRITNLRSDAEALAGFAERQKARGVTGPAEAAERAADYARAAANLYERGEIAAANEARDQHLAIVAQHRLGGIR